MQWSPTTLVLLSRLHRCNDLVNALDDLLPFLAHITLYESFMENPSEYLENETKSCRTKKKNLKILLRIDGLSALFNSISLSLSESRKQGSVYNSSFDTEALLWLGLGLLEDMCWQLVMLWCQVPLSEREEHNYLTCFLHQPLDPARKGEIIDLMIWMHKNPVSDSSCRGRLNGCFDCSKLFELLIVCSCKMHINCCEY